MGGIICVTQLRAPAFHLCDPSGDMRIKFVPNFVLFHVMRVFLQVLCFFPLSKTNKMQR